MSNERRCPDRAAAAWQRLAVAVLPKRARRRSRSAGRGARTGSAHHRARRANAGADRHRDRVAARARSASAAALRARRAARAHRAQLTRHHRRRLPRRGPGVVDQLGQRTSHGHARHANRPIDGRPDHARSATRGRIARGNPTWDWRFWLYRRLRSVARFCARRARNRSLLPLNLMVPVPPMPLVSRKSILALAAVIDVAVNAGNRPVSAKTLAARQKLPPRHLEPVLQALVHDGILKGIRGPRGGYELARGRGDITAEDIL